MEQALIKQKLSSARGSFIYGEQDGVGEVRQLYKDFWSWRKPSRAKLFKDEPILTQNTQLLTQAIAKVQSQVL